jgi:hypothetical protein
MSSLYQTSLTAAEHDAGTTVTKAKKIGYWVSTGVLAFCLTGGIFQLLGVEATVQGIMSLGYPSYIIPVLGLAKVLAILAILSPGLPRLKEWAYAGIFFNMIGAAVSHFSNHDEKWIIAVTTTLAALTLVSWALRPQSRRLGDPLKRVEV